MPGHKYEAEKAGRLDGRLRRFLMPPEKILGDFTPGPHEIWAEVGAGTGYFAIPLAGMVDKVYALDLSERMLGLLEQNITKSQTGNIEPLRSEENRLPLPDERVDAVLLALVLHEADEPKRFLTEIARVIKTGGRLCVIEFTQTGKFGPPRSHRLTSGQINDVAGIAGFRPARKHEWRRRLLGWTYLDLAGFEYVKQSGQE